MKRTNFIDTLEKELIYNQEKIYKYEELIAYLENHEEVFYNSDLQDIEELIRFTEEQKNKLLRKILVDKLLLNI